MLNLFKRRIYVGSHEAANRANAARMVTEAFAACNPDDLPDAIQDALIRNFKLNPKTIKQIHHAVQDVALNSGRLSA